MQDPLQLDSAVHCGLVLGGTDARVVDLARRGEAAGFDSLWTGDHVSFHVPILESLTLLSVVAAVTERVALGTAVYLLPLRHPTLTAKTTSTLDMLSGGRLVLGVGVGGEFPAEFEACGVPVRERGTRADEAIAVLRELWSRDAVTHAGRHFRFGPISIDPKPAQIGGPRIWVGGRKAPALRRAGRLGDGYISHMASPEMFRAHLEEIRTHARDAKRPPASFGTAAFLFTVLDDRYEAALERAATMLGTIYNRPFRDAARKYCLLGSAEDCLERIEQFVHAGCRHILLAPLGDPESFLERATAEILPGLRAIST